MKFELLALWDESPAASLVWIWYNLPHKDMTDKWLSPYATPPKVCHSLFTFEELLYWSFTLPCLARATIWLFMAKRVSPQQSMHNILQQTIHTHNE